VPERVGALVDERHVAPHLQPEPSGGALLAGHAVQVALEVVERLRRARPAQPRRARRVDGQRHGHVHVPQRRVERHHVALVPHVQRPQVRERGEGGLEEGTPHAWAREHDGRHRAARPLRLRLRGRGRGAAAGAGGGGGAGRVHAVGDHVHGVERGERRAEAVPGDADARLLVLVQLHQPPDLLKNLQYARRFRLLQPSDKANGT
uniref:Uncharacterized protein n=1 Tax=Zea mays TaxID=4577 RepID=A0A804LKN0_MAIZE